MRKEWRGFKGNKWQTEVNLRDFIQNNYTSYDGDESFLAEPTQATDTLWGMLKELQKEERAKGGVLDMETEVVSGLTAYGAARSSPRHTRSFRKGRRRNAQLLYARLSHLCRWF